MQKVTHAKLQKLLSLKNAPAVTLYMPTHRIPGAEHQRENITRYRNLIRRAEQLMRDQTIKSADMQAVLERMEALVDDQAFWRDQTEGLIIAANPRQLTYFNLPITTDEYVAVDSHFHLVPLFSLESANKNYYVLVLAQHLPQLHQGDGYGLQENMLELPQSPEKALHIDEMQQKQQHYHGKAGGMATGQRAGSNAKDAGGEERLRFYRLIDQKLLNHLNTRLPLLLAGTSNDIAEYRSISNYPNLMRATLEGNHVNTPGGDLALMAWKEVYREIVLNEERQAVAAFEERKAAHRSLSDLAQIVKAAEAGRVESLLLPMYTRTADTIDDHLVEQPKIIFSETPEQLAVDKAALHTWSLGGTILNLHPSVAPARFKPAAILRY